MNMTRQQRRATDRRAEKPEPATIERTSTRHIGRTKGQPYSRQQLVRATPSQSGIPAKFHVRSYTRKTSSVISATFENIDWFFKGITDDMKMALLGRY